MFTAEQALTEEGRTIFLSVKAAERILRDHGFTLQEYLQECTEGVITARGLLEWLGY